MKSEQINVLMVDDELEFLEQAKTLLEEKDNRFVIMTSNNVEESLKIIENENIDAVVSDYKMPEKDGIKFLRILREEKESRIPFILFTGRGWEEVAMNALNFGANKYIWKKEELNLYNKKQKESVDQYEKLAKEILKEVKKYENEETTDLLRQTIEKANDGIFWISPKGKILYGNQTIRDMLGYNQRELQNLDVSDIDPKFLEDKRESFWERLKEEEIITIKTEHQGKDGTVFPVEITSNYVRHEDKEIEFAFVRRIGE